MSTIMDTAVEPLNLPTVPAFPAALTHAEDSADGDDAHAAEAIRPVTA